MQVSANWQPIKTSPGAEVYRVNNIRVARVWRNKLDFQIAVDLPDADIKKHLFDTLSQAKAYVEERVKLWFDKVDA